MTQALEYLSMGLITDDGELIHLIQSRFPPNSGALRTSFMSPSLHTVDKKMAEFGTRVMLIDSRVLTTAESLKLVAGQIERWRMHEAYAIITIALCHAREWVQTLTNLGAMGAVELPLSTLDLEELSAQIGMAGHNALQERQNAMWHDRVAPAWRKVMNDNFVPQQSITFWSTKGGVGKSLIAREVAVGLGTMAGAPTLLVDLDQNSGDQGTYMNVDAKARNVHNLSRRYLERGGQLHKEDVHKELYRVKGSELHVLCGTPSMIMTGDEVLRSEAFAQALFNAVTGMGFQFVVFDLGQNFFEPLHYVPLTRSSQNFVIATGERATALELVAALAGLRERLPGEVETKRYGLVLNKWTEHGKLDRRQLVSSVGLAERACLPYYDYEYVTDMLNRGKPIILETNPLGNALLELAAGIHPGLRPKLEERLNKRGGSKLFDVFKGKQKVVAGV